MSPATFPPSLIIHMRTSELLSTISLAALRPGAPKSAGARLRWLAPLASPLRSGYTGRQEADHAKRKIPKPTNHLWRRDKSRYKPLARESDYISRLGGSSPASHDRG